MNNKTLINKGTRMNNKTLIKNNIARSFADKCSIIDLEEWSAIAQQAHEAQQSRKYFAEKEKALLKKLHKASEGKPHSDGLYAYSKTYRKGSIDYTAIPELEHIDLEQFRKDKVEIWRLTSIAE